MIWISRYFFTFFLSCKWRLHSEPKTYKKHVVCDTSSCTCNESTVTVIISKPFMLQRLSVQHRGKQSPLTRLTSVQFFGVLLQRFFQTEHALMNIFWSDPFSMFTLEKLICVKNRNVFCFFYIKLTFSDTREKPFVSRRVSCLIHSRLNFPFLYCYFCYSHHKNSSHYVTYSYTSIYINTCTCTCFFFIIMKKIERKRG